MKRACLLAAVGVLLGASCTTTPTSSPVPTSSASVSASPSPSTSEPLPSLTIEVVVAGGVVVGGARRYEVAVGEMVLLRVSSDVADEIHVHVYDVFTSLSAGVTIEVRFVADIPGVIEIELEDSGIVLATLEVQG